MNAKRVRQKLESRTSKGSMPGLAAWSTYGGGTRVIVHEGRSYSITPKNRLDEQRRAGGWDLSVTPAPSGLHGWIGPKGEVSYLGWSWPFRSPQAAASAAKIFAKKVGPEPHGIMQKWGKAQDELVAIMREPDFWQNVARLKEGAAEAGDLWMARICNVALSEKEIRPEGHDARECASAIRDARAMGG